MGTKKGEHFQGSSDESDGFVGSTSSLITGDP